MLLHFSYISCALSSLVISTVLTSRLCTLSDATTGASNTNLSMQSMLEHTKSVTMSSNLASLLPRPGMCAMQAFSYPV